MDELKKIASKNKIPIIEDAAHALGATYNNKPIGNISEFTMFSFQAIKHMEPGVKILLQAFDSKNNFYAKKNYQPKKFLDFLGHTTP